MTRVLLPVLGLTLLVTSCVPSPRDVGDRRGDCPPGRSGDSAHGARRLGAASGLFIDGAPTSDVGVAALDAWTRTVGQRPRHVMWFTNWATDFQGGAVEQAYRRGAVPIVTWEMYGKDRAAISYADVLSGTRNAYIDRWADAARADGRTVLVRLGHEMNGDWYPWSGARNGGGPQAPRTYVKVWRYVHDRVRARGAVNVRWVWTPNNTSFPDEPWNAPANYYPGDAYIDWVGADGYNFGTSQRVSTGAAFDSKWQTFDEIFCGIYAQVRAVAPTKPFMIGEFASSEQGGDKAAWIADAARRVGDYPAILAWTWFNHDKETDWRVESSPASLAAFRAAFGDPGAFGWTDR